MLGAFAEFERALIRERQLEGIALAKARGAYTGRKPSLTPSQVEVLRARAAAGEPKAGLAREFGISRQTLYSYLSPPVPASSVDRPGRAWPGQDGVMADTSSWGTAKISTKPTVGRPRRALRPSPLLAAGSGRQRDCLFSEAVDQVFRPKASGSLKSGQGWLQRTSLL